MRKLMLFLILAFAVVACVPDQSMKPGGSDAAISEAGELTPAGKEPQLVLEAGGHLALVRSLLCTAGGSFSNYTWNSSLEGNGYSGSATTLQCYRFGDNPEVAVSMAIRDLPDDISNTETIIILKPEGSN